MEVFGWKGFPGGENTAKYMYCMIAEMYRRYLHLPLFFSLPRSSFFYSCFVIFCVCCFVFRVECKREIVPHIPHALH